MHQHFVDLHKAPEVEIMAEKRELGNLSSAAAKHRGTCALEKPPCHPGNDDHLVACVDGSCIPRNGCRGKRGGLDGDQSKKRKNDGILDGEIFTGS